MTKPAPKQDDPAQSKRFIEMARELGADGDEKAFGKAFDKVVTGKPGHPEPQQPRKKPAKKR
jgi:hypothetical protein